MSEPPGPLGRAQSARQALRARPSGRWGWLTPGDGVVKAAMGANGHADRALMGQAQVVQSGFGTHQRVVKLLNSA